ncbi:MAG: DUF2723 domain-containing protein [Candidatus Sumerlaeia bacterium]|nr:DUF2723 domain-containing protein [Candidatus Sumerlaeia bacterium]
MSAARGAAVAGAGAFAAYALTAPRDILWGDGLELASVASHFGVAHPPGYPLYALLGGGWLTVSGGALPPYAALALLNCLFAAFAAALLGLLGASLWARHRAPGTPGAAGWTAGLLTAAAALLRSFWESGTIVEVYALGAMLGAGFLLVLAEDGARLSARRFLLAGILLGCLAANHLPSVSVALVLAARAIQLRRAGRSAWPPLAAAALAVTVAALLYGTLLVSAGREGRRIAWGGTSNLPALLAHARGGEYSRALLRPARLDRRLTAREFAHFASARAWELAGAASTQLSRAAVPGAILASLVLGLGASALWPRDPVLVLASAGAAGAQTAFLFLYVIPDFQDYLLGIVVASSPVWLAGAASMLDLVIEWARRPGRPMIAGIAAGALAASTAIGNGSASLARNAELDARPWLDRALAALPEGAAVLTHGDADTYALWYAALAERSRPDLLVIGTNFLRFPWFARTLPREHPAAGVVRFEAAGPPLGPGAFASLVERQAIRPLLGAGDVFMMEPDGIVGPIWFERFRPEPVAVLLTPQELETLLSAGRGVPPPRLFRIPAAATP